MVNKNIKIEVLTEGRALMRGEGGKGYFKTKNWFCAKKNR